MKEVLQQLANLQYIDNRIDEIRQLQGDLPEEILDIETDINRANAKLKKLDEENEALQEERTKLRNQIAESEQLIEKYEDQQTSVRNNREYDALTKEIETQKQNMENAESRIEEINVREKEIETEREQAEEELNKVQHLLDTKKEELDEVVDKTKSEEDVLLEKRKELEKELDDRYLKSYKRLRKGLSNGMAVVPMEKGSALGMMLPPQLQVEVRRKNKIIIDENSGRIVVDPVFFENAKKELAL